MISDSFFILTYYNEIEQLNIEISHISERNFIFFYAYFVFFFSKQNAK